MKYERVTGCHSCGKPAALVGDEPSAEFERCFWCEAERKPGAMALFLKAERDRILAIFENAPHRSVADDGTEILEWIAPDFRVGVSLEAVRADSWFFVVEGGKRMCGGDIEKG